jgi:hypothetical protein
LEPLREAITAFQITDVFKKSGGLAKTLSERKPIPNTFQIVEPIRKLGFFIDDKQTPIKVLSAGGQLSFTTSAGLAYQLWFGNLLPGTSGNPDQRYLMVSVDVDELKFPMPVKPGIGNASVNKPDESGAEKKNNGPPSPPKNGCEPNSIEPMVIEPTSRITQSQDDEREANRQYQIQLDTRNEKLAAQRKIADNINRRFADWFYLVDNAVYERVMPVQENVISTK